MLDVILAATTAGPIPSAPGPVWAGVQNFWTGWNGRRYALDSDSSAVRLLAGVEGRTMPSSEMWMVESPTVNGSRYRGHRWAAREVRWPVGVYAEGGSEEWLRVDREFWETMRPDKPGMWEVQTPSGGKRTLLCRFLADGMPPSHHSPGLYGWQHYLLQMAADDPFWRSAPVTQSWTTLEGVPFLDPAGSPPLHISPSATLATATVENPGDMEAWPTWRATAAPDGGGVESVTVGVSGQLVTYPLPILPGQTLEIRTDPTDQRAFLNEVEVTRQLTTFDFAPIPAGESVPLQLSMTGQGTVTAAFTPRHLRAW